MCRKVTLERKPENNFTGYNSNEKQVRTIKFYDLKYDLIKWKDLRDGSDCPRGQVQYLSAKELINM